MRAQPIISLQRAESPDDEGPSWTDIVPGGTQHPRGRNTLQPVVPSVSGDNVSSQP